MLGILMLEGTGVEKSAAGAAKLFEKASVDNDMVAVYNLGVLLQTGRGVKLSPNKGAELIRKAATAGTAEAQFAVSQWFSSRTLLAPVKWARKVPRVSGPQSAQRLGAGGQVRCGEIAPQAFRVVHEGGAPGAPGRPTQRCSGPHGRSWGRQKP